MSTRRNLVRMMGTLAVLLFLSSCGAVNPTPAIPVGPQPQNIPPGGEQPGIIQPGGEQPGNIQPGGEQPPMPGPGQPAAPTTTSGGGGSTTSGETSVCDLAADSIGLSTSSNVWYVDFSFTNQGSADCTGDITVTCSGTYSNTAGTLFKSFNPVEYTATDVNLPPSTGAGVEMVVSLPDDLSSRTVKVTCSMTPPSSDVNSSNNTLSVTCVNLYCYTGY